MAQDKRPAIKDVGARAGVSRSTDSRVRRRSGVGKAETRDAVHVAMQELGYVRNRAAAALRGSATGLVGLVINDLRNPFIPEFATSVQMALAERGLATVIANCDEDAGTQNRTILSMLEHEVTGIVISPCYRDIAPGYAAITRAGLPSLQVLRRVDSEAPTLPFFSHDYAEGSRVAARHLLDQGITRIAFVGGIKGRDITNERMSGYLAEMQREGLTPVVLPGPSTRLFGRDMAAVLARDHPDIQAAICFNDLVALGLHAGLPAAGRQPGRVIFLLGYDDIEEASLVHPPLSTVRCDVARFGDMSARMLSDMIEKSAEPEASETRLSVELVVRATSTKGAE